MIFNKGTIFFGTKYENIYMLDLEGISKPLSRNEQYISVSQSGYVGSVSCFKHNELTFLSSVYVDNLKAANINDNGYLEWKDGYKNSLTYNDAFGPCDLEEYNCFGKKIKNNRKGENICAVIDPKFVVELVIPDKPLGDEISFEYLSTALHPFIKRILPEMIVGWVADNKSCDKLITDMNSSRLKKRTIWLVEDL